MAVPSARSASSQSLVLVRSRGTTLAAMRHLLALRR